MVLLVLADGAAGVEWWCCWCWRVLLLVLADGAAGVGWCCWCWQMVLLVLDGAGGAGGAVQ
jgi:hypothetical protein